MTLPLGRPWVSLRCMSALPLRRDDGDAFWCLHGDRSGTGADNLETFLRFLHLSNAQVFLRNAEGEVIDREAAASAATIETVLSERADGSRRRSIQTIHRNEHGTFFQVGSEGVLWNSGSALVVCRDISVKCSKRLHKRRKPSPRLPCVFCFFITFTLLISYTLCPSPSDRPSLARRYSKATGGGGAWKKRRQQREYQVC